MTVSRESVSRAELPVSDKYFITYIVSVSAKDCRKDGDMTIPYALHPGLL